VDGEVAASVCMRRSRSETEAPTPPEAVRPVNASLTLGIRLPRMRLALCDPESDAGATPAPHVLRQALATPRASRMHRTAYCLINEASRIERGVAWGVQQNGRGWLYFRGEDMGDTSEPVSD
jgi:hypothetical protein